NIRKGEIFLPKSIKLERIDIITESSWLLRDNKENQYHLELIGLQQSDPFSNVWSAILSDIHERKLLSIQLSKFEYITSPLTEIHPNINPSDIYKHIHIESSPDSLGGFFLIHKHENIPQSSLPSQKQIGTMMYYRREDNQI